MTKPRNKFDGLNEEKNTWVQIFYTTFTLIFAFLGLSATLGLWVFLATHD